MSNAVINPIQFFVDQQGKPLDGGSIYIGAANTNPVTNPVTVYQDAKTTIPMQQPLRTIQGSIALNGNAIPIYVAASTYSISVFDKNGVLVQSDMDVNPVFTYSQSKLSLTVTSIAQLRTLLSTLSSEAFVTGYYSQGDGGGGPYYFDPADTTSADNGGTIIVASDGARWKLDITGPVTANVFGALGDGKTDDTSAIQSALNALPEIHLIAGKKYIVSPQNLTTPEGGVGICLNINSGNRLIMHGATIVQKSGTTGSGAIIGNTAPVTKVLIQGGAIDGNNANTTGNMCTVVLWNATDSVIDSVYTQNNRYVGAGFRATTVGVGRNVVRNCTVEGTLYIGIGVSKQDLGIAIIDNIVESATNNAIDIEGNNLAGDPGKTNRVVVTGNRCLSCASGIFLESDGNAIISGNVVQNFNSAGIYLNRINSGSLTNLIVANQILDGANVNGIFISNSSGKTVISDNYFRTLLNSIYCANTADYLSIGKNLHESISGVLLYMPPAANQLVKSRITSQDYIGGRINGVPFTASPLGNTNNYPTRSYRVLASPMFSMDDGTITGTTSDAEYIYATGALIANSAWAGAYALYTNGMTLVNLSGAQAPSYIFINGTLYYLAAYVSGAWQIQNLSKQNGDYTASVNGAYAWTDYYTQWQTG